MRYSIIKAIGSFPARIQPSVRPASRQRKDSEVDQVAGKSTRCRWRWLNLRQRRVWQHRILSETKSLDFLPQRPTQRPKQIAQNHECYNTYRRNKVTSSVYSVKHSRTECNRQRICGSEVRQWSTLSSKLWVSSRSPCFCGSCAANSIPTVIRKCISFCQIYERTALG